MTTLFKLGTEAEKYTCPECKTNFKEGEEVISCPSCKALYHVTCWKDNNEFTASACPEQHYEAQGTNTTDVCQNCGTTLGDGHIFCPKCGTPKGEVKKSFCRKCGTELLAGQEFCPKCGTPKGETKKKYCGKCGTELLAGQEFCSKCGQKAGLQIDASGDFAISQFNSTIKKEKVKSKDGIIYTVLGLISAILLFADGFCIGETEFVFCRASYYSKISMIRSYMLMLLACPYYNYMISLTPIAIICILLLLIVIFSWIKDKNPKFNVVNIFLSAISFSILLISSLGCFLLERFDGGTISFGINFYVELLLLAILFVLSIINKKGKIFIK